MRLLAFALIPLFASACDATLQPGRMIPRWTTAWREVAKPEDAARLHDWRTTFTAALDAARKTGHAADIAREGALLDPDAALGGGPIPNGTYRCRVIKLGAKDPGNLDYVVYPGFTCTIGSDRNLQLLNKLNGSQRYVGLVFPGDAIRQVFLGTLALGDEARALRYGQDETRDVAGFVERIGPNRWRLIMPKPNFESQLDVMELVPLTKDTR